MPLAAVTAATCLCAAFGSILMGHRRQLPARPRPRHGPQRLLHLHRLSRDAHPLANRPRRGLSLRHHLPRPHLRRHPPALVAAIPHQLHAAVAGGIGLFIAFIGFRNAGIIVPRPATLVTLGNIRTPPLSPSSACCSSSSCKSCASAPPCSSASSPPCSLGHLSTRSTGPQPYGFLSAIRHRLPPRHPRRPQHRRCFEIIFVFLFVDLFDNIGTLVAVTQRAGLIAPTTPSPASTASSSPTPPPPSSARSPALSTVTSYIESSAGVAAGGRTGVTAIVTGMLFLSPSSSPLCRASSLLRHRARAHPRRRHSCSSISGTPSTGTIPRYSIAIPPSSPHRPFPSPGPSPTASASASPATPLIQLLTGRAPRTDRRVAYT
jgi:AGZA family xanthine/uracil permease-like MFS transporter